MLVTRRARQSPASWILAVNKIRESSLDKPEQYIGQELPSKEETKMLINLIFDEFIRMEKSEVEELASDEFTLQLTPEPSPVA
jgi:hypothetical protein